MKNFLSIAMAFLGIAIFICGSYMAHEVAAQQQHLYQAESAGQRRPTLGPVRRAARADAAENKQQMLGQMGQKINASQVTADWLRGIGAVVVIAAIGSLFIRRKTH
jgi:hypothetical protein